MNIYSSSFGSSLARTPDQAALCVQGVTYSYRQLDGIVAELRLQLRACNLAAGEPVAVLASRSLTAYAAVLACAAEGLPWVPLNPAFPDGRNQRMFGLSGARTVVVGAEAAAQLQGIFPQTPPRYVLALDPHMQPHMQPGMQPGMQQHEAASPLATQGNGLANCADVDSRQTAYLLFTSGTTGVPKGIPVSVGNLLAYLDNFSALYPLPFGLRFSQMFDLTFDLSVHDMFVCWHSGGCLVVPAAQDLLMPLQFVRRQQVQVWFSVPSMASIAKQSGLLRAGVLPSLQFAFFCGEALPVTSALAWMDAAPNALVANLYGPTEATIAITAFTLARDCDDWQKEGVVPIGFPYPGQQARVVNGQGEDVGEGETGELWLAGTQLAAGYLQDAEKTAAVFVERCFPGCNEIRWYRTGDCARWHPRFGLQYGGRLDRQVKISGFRVELQEVEHCLRQAAGTELVAVLPWPPGADGLHTGIAAFIVNATADHELIQQRLADMLPAYMQTRQIIALPQLPVNANGKVDYNALLQWLTAG